MKYIIKHLKKQYPNILEKRKTKIYSFPIPLKCGYTGKKITKGVKISEIFKPNFTEIENFKYIESGYLSVDIAISLTSFDGRAGLRNFCLYANEKKLKFVKYSNYLDLIMNIPDIPFDICFTFGGKKHVAYKSTLQHDKNNFIIETDKGTAYFNRKEINEFLPIMQKWYSEFEKNKTYFIKKQISGEEEINPRQIIRYGKDKFFAEKKIINKYKNKLIFKLFTKILQKNGNN